MCTLCNSSVSLSWLQSPSMPYPIRVIITCAPYLASLEYLLWFMLQPHSPRSSPSSFSSTFDAMMLRPYVNICLVSFCDALVTLVSAPVVLAVRFRWSCNIPCFPSTIAPLSLGLVNPSFPWFSQSDSPNHNWTSKLFLNWLDQTILSKPKNWRSLHPRHHIHMRPTK